jgi:hypothetical protein
MPTPKNSKQHKEKDSPTQAPESGEPKDRLVKSTRRLEKTRHSGKQVETNPQDHSGGDIREAPESGRQSAGQ